MKRRRDGWEERWREKALRYKNLKVLERLSDEVKMHCGTMCVWVPVFMCVFVCGGKRLLTDDVCSE